MDGFVCLEVWVLERAFFFTFCSLSFVRGFEREREGGRREENRSPQLLFYIS